MGRECGAVRFEDGSIKLAVFGNTGDCMADRLFETVEEMEIGIESWYGDDA